MKWHKRRNVNVEIEKNIQAEARRGVVHAIRGRQIPAATDVLEARVVDCVLPAINNVVHVALELKAQSEGI